MASDDTPSAAGLGNPQLSDALQTKDMAAVAFALRHGPTVVPLSAPPRGGAFGDADVWRFDDPATGGAVLLLFSDESYRPGSVPPHAALASPGWLRSYLTGDGADVSTVFFDISGPHPLRAAPADIVAALDA